MSRQGRVVKPAIRFDGTVKSAQSAPDFPLIRLISMRLALILMLCLALPSPAAAWTEPARGTAERRAMMDAMRPLAEMNLGAPVEFVVHGLRVDGRAGFAMVSAQRPGGGEIDLAQTPLVRQQGLDPEFMDGASMQALLWKSGQSWVVAHWAIGATDVWWADPAFCPQWAAVTPEVC